MTFSVSLLSAIATGGGDSKAGLIQGPGKRQSHRAEFAGLGLRKWRILQPRLALCFKSRFSQNVLVLLLFVNVAASKDLR